MKNTFIKNAGIALIVLICFYIIQYFATAIHVGCQNPAEDCPPLIYGVGEILYRLIVEPPWLTLNG